MMIDMSHELTAAYFIGPHCGHTWRTGHFILGDPGATSRDMIYFRRESEEPLGTYYYPTSSRSGLIPFCRLARKIIFWPISEEIQPGNSISFLCEVVFFLGPYTRKILAESFRKKKTIQRSRGICKP